MRVLHINCNYLGTTLHQNMVRELNSIGIENEVFVPISDEYSQFAIAPDSCTTIRRCFKKKDRIFFYLKQKKILQSIEESYDIRRFDLIHAYTVFTDGNIARLLSKKYGIPFVVAVRNTDVNAFFKYRFYLRMLGIKILESSNRVFFLSKPYLNKILQEYTPNKKRDLISKKARLIPNGIDEYWLNHKYYDRDYSLILNNIKKRRISLIYAGRIDKNKNLVSVDEAIAILKKDGWDVSYVVVGKIEDEGIYTRLKNRDYFTYFEPVSKEKLIDHYRNADIFVMPSKTETFGLVYAEAMTQGLPVIYSKGQGFDGQFKDGEVGFSVDSSNPKEIAEKILLVCSNYYDMSIKCLDCVDHFSWEKIIKEYQSIYSELLERMHNED